MSKEINEFERDLKGYPDLREEKTYQNKQDFDYECALEEASNIIKFNEAIQLKNKQIGQIIEEYNHSIDELLADYHQDIIDRFKYKG